MRDQTGAFSLRSQLGHSTLPVRLPHSSTSAGYGASRGRSLPWLSIPVGRSFDPDAAVSNGIGLAAVPNGGCESDELVASEGTKLGIRFSSFPPGPVIIERVSAGSWAEANGVTSGSELTTVNGCNVSSLDEDQFRNLMKERPLGLHVWIDPRQLTIDIGNCASASSLLTLIAPRISSFNKFHFGVTFTRLAKCKFSFDDDVARSPVLTSLLKHAEASLERNEWDARQVANIIWALGKLKKKISCFRNLVPSLVKAAVSKADGMTAQTLSNILWATATLRKEAPELQEVLPRIMECISSVADSLVAQHVANSLWSIAVLRKDFPAGRDLAPLLVELAGERAESMKPQGLSNTIWSVGVLRLRSADVEVMCTRLLKRAASQIHLFIPQEMANLCDGLAAVGVEDAGIMELIASRTVRDATTFSRQDRLLGLPQIILAHAKLRLHNDDLSQFVATSLKHDLRELNDWDLCALAWSYREVGKGSDFDGFVKALKRDVSRRCITQETLAKAAELGPDDWTDWRSGK